MTDEPKDPMEMTPNLANLPWHDQDKIPYYVRLTKESVLPLLDPLVRQGFRHRFGDAKLEGTFSLAGNPPWHYVHLDYENDCWMQQSVLFKIVSHQTNRKFAPSHCHQCWKVVVQGAPGNDKMPMTLRGLFALLDIELALNRPSKCGVEVRHYTSAQYGGYFYCHSLEEGLQRYKEVRKAIDDHPLLGPDTFCILKRGCTEFELALGPSCDYNATPDQLDLEKRIKAHIHTDPNIHAQPPSIVKRVHKRWIDHAIAIGDLDYLHYTGGYRVYPAPVTYHHLLEHYEKGWRPTGEFQDGNPILVRMPLPVEVKEIGGGWFEVSDKFGGYAKVQGREKAETLAQKMSAGGQRIVVGGDHVRQDDATKNAALPPSVHTGSGDEGASATTTRWRHDPPMFLREDADGLKESTGEGATGPSEGAAQS